MRHSGAGILDVLLVVKDLGVLRNSLEGNLPVNEMTHEISCHEQVAAGEEPGQGVQVGGEGDEEEVQGDGGSSSGPELVGRVVVVVRGHEATEQVATDLKRELGKEDNETRMNVL